MVPSGGSGGSRWSAIWTVRRIQLACGLAASVSAVGVLVTVPSVPRVPAWVWDRAPQPGVAPTGHVHFVSLIQVEQPPLVWWLLVAGVTLGALAVGVCAAFDVRTQERRWRRMLVACGVLVAVGLGVLAGGSLSLFEDGPVLFVPSEVPILACIGLSFLSGRRPGPRAVAATA